MKKTVDRLAILFNRSLSAAMHRMAPANVLADNSLLFWRVKIMATTLLCGWLICTFALGHAVLFLVKSKLWWLLAFDLAGYLVLVALILVRGPGYQLRAVVTVAVMFIIGVAVVFTLGPLSGGPLWLFAFAVMAGALLGSKAVLLAAGMNTFVLALLCWLIQTGRFGQHFPFFLTESAMYAALLSFVVLHLLTAATVSVLVKGLSISHAQEQALRNTLESESDRLAQANASLAQANARLEIEIEERRQAEAAVRDSEQKYRLLADNASDIIWLMDLEKNGRLRPTYISPSVKRIRGYTPEEALAQSMEEILTPESYNRVIQQFWSSSGQKQNLKSGKVFAVEVEMYCKDGSTIWAEIKASLINDDTGRPVAVLGVSRDVSYRKAAEREKAELENRLRQAQKMEAIGTLAGGIAHDFNNILSAIIGFGELCIDDVPRGSLLHENLKEITSAGVRAKELVKQILTFARQGDEDLSPVQVSLIVKEALKLLRSSIPKTIEIEMAIQSNAVIMGNATQIHQVLMNLCTNASHAMERTGGTLTVTLTEVQQEMVPSDQKSPVRPGTYARLSVSDTGMGIEKEILPVIFDPYFTTKEVGKGTGMGLAVVHGIVQSYAGKIEVDSTPGKGTTVAIYWPVHKAANESGKALELASPGGNERILFVDDEAAIAKMGGQILSRLGYRVTIRTSSADALALFREKPWDVDLVVTDMTMPGMTGEQLAAEMMSVRSDIPIILCTGYSSTMSAEKASAVGIQGFAYKPIVKAELARLVRKVLDNHPRRGMNVAVAS